MPYSHWQSRHPPCLLLHIHCQKKTFFKLGIARDKAFCFYYAENLEVLQQCGAELVDISPLSDKQLPTDIDGLYFGGGYPELYLPQLSQNYDFINSLRQASAKKIPILAECGGFLYLQESISDTHNIPYPMAGLLPGHAKLTDTLCRFGYVTAVSQQDSLFGKAGIRIRAHEFHYADSSENGSAFIIQRPSGKTWNAIQCTNHILAGFPHFYFLSNPEAVRNFCICCQQFRERRIHPC